jgi:hypoxanthine phosphoribosyltransferase
MRCELVTWAAVYSRCRRLVRKIRESGFAPDLIVGIGRGGYIPARVISDFLGIMDLASFKIEHYHAAQRDVSAMVKYPLAADVEARHVLLVDDVTDSGDTFDVAIAHLSERGTPSTIHTAVLDHKVSSSYTPDYFGRKVIKWRWIIYPWAVIEDLSGFVASMHTPSSNIETIRKRLADEHGIRVPRATLDDLITSMHAQAQLSGTCAS